MMDNDDMKNDMKNGWTQELFNTRRRRARITALLLGAFVVLFFLVTVIRLGANVLNRPL